MAKLNSKKQQKIMLEQKKSLVGSTSALRYHVCRCCKINHLPLVFTETPLTNNPFANRHMLKRKKIIITYYIHFHFQYMFRKKSITRDQIQPQKSELNVYYVCQWFSTFFGWRHTLCQNNFCGTPKTMTIRFSFITSNNSCFIVLLPS